MTSRLLKFARLSLSEKLLLLEAAMFLASARLAVLLLPFRLIAPFLGREQRESPMEIAPAQAGAANRVGASILLMSRHAPWRSTCLAQAVAAQLMLKRRGIPGTLYLGAVKDGDNNLLAHAWVRCGNGILTGESGRERFTAIASFAPDSPEIM